VIAWLKGNLVEKRVGEIILDVGGVGYRLFVPLSTYYSLPERGQEATFRVHTHVREDQITLYGFSTEEEREWFQHLIRVSGIGPRLAVNILSGISCEDLRLAIASGDSTRLQAIPGIGKKMAARMVVEMKERYPSLTGGESQEGPDVPTGRPVSLFTDAVSALLNLGFNPQESAKVVRKILAETPETRALEDVIKVALKSLRRSR